MQKVEGLKLKKKRMSGKTMFEGGLFSWLWGRPREWRGNEANDWLYTLSLWKLIGRELEGTNLNTLLGKCGATNYEG